VFVGIRGRSVTLDQIDAALADWHGRLRLAGNNIMALSQHDAYRRLRGEGGWPRAVLAGTTAARVAPALEALQELWSHFARLTDLVERADAIRQGVSRLFPSRLALDEIAALLTGPSIRLPPLTTPLARRDLLGPAEVERAVTADELLAAMTKCFEAARDAVLAVGSAWDRVPAALDRIDAEAAALLAPGTLPAEMADDMLRVRRELDELRPTADADPLGTDERLGRLAGRVAAVRDRLAEDARDRERLGAALADARGLLARVTAVAREAESVVAERVLKVEADSPPVPPPDPADVTALGPWLDRLDAVRDAGRVRAARIGLGKWTQAADGLLRQAEAARDAARAVLDRRRDLRGLFGALRAKAAAVGRADDPELAAPANQADELLRRRPTPLVAAERLVAEYQRRLM